MAFKKSCNVGKYSLACNAFIVSLYAFISFFGQSTLHLEWQNIVLSLLFTLIYFVIVSIVIDLINTRNKKFQVQIVTSDSRTIDIIMSLFPHAATVVQGKGAYTGLEKQIVFIVVSPHEVNKVATVARQIDAHAFISVVELKTVFGNFFIKPLE